MPPWHAKLQLHDCCLQVSSMENIQIEINPNVKIVFITILKILERNF